jgi:tRNA A37 N6-isopentenylltransferase MiaA
MSSEHEDFLAWERVAALLSSEETASAEELRADLEAQGIDVENGTQRLRKMVRQTFQQQLREQAVTEAEGLRPRTEEISSEVAAWSFVVVLEWIEKAKAGVMGDDVANLALAYHRNKQGKDLTEAEARSLVSDILAAKM